MERVVLDTNVLVDGSQDDYSASWRIVEQVLDGKLRALLSKELRGEYELILGRAVTDSTYHHRMSSFLRATEHIHLGHIPHIVLDDPEDDKVLATAYVGNADVLITSDKHLLGLDPYKGLRIVTPRAFLHIQEEDNDSSWLDFAKQMGIG